MTNFPMKADWALDLKGEKTQKRGRNISVAFCQCALGGVGR